MTTSASSPPKASEPTAPTITTAPQPPQYVGLKKACSLCRQAHAACDGGHPCQRCVASGQGARCVFLPSRKRGRPPKGTIQFDQTSTSTSSSRVSPTTTQPSDPPSRRKQKRVESPTPTGQPGGIRRPVVPLAPRPDSASRTASHKSPLSKYSPDSSPQQSPPSLGLGLRGNDSGPASPPEEIIINDGAIPNSLLSMLVEQLRDMRQENQQLREEMQSLSSLQKVSERRVEELQEENQANMKRILSMLTANQRDTTQFGSIPVTQSLDPNDLFSTSATSDSQSSYTHLASAARILPFLREYESIDAPFVLDDLSKPFAALSLNEPEDVSQLKPPLFAYVSPSFCSITGYDAEELVGSPITTLCAHIDIITRQRILQHAFTSGASQIGSLFSTMPLWTTKKGIFMRLAARNQMLFSARGKVKWLIIVVDQIVESIKSIDIRTYLSFLGGFGVNSSDKAAFLEPSARAASSDVTPAFRSVANCSDPTSEEGYGQESGSSSRASTQASTDDIDSLWMALSPSSPAPATMDFLLADSLNFPL